MTTARHTLFPEIEPYATGRLKVGDLHDIYYEECGNPDGKPVVLVHGGPGGGSNPTMRRLHDPQAYRIILFDQRGCGRSTPYADLRDNTTWDLVADMEALRAHLNVSRWQVFGGSWGSTLALTYAISHPQAVSELILRGIFMLRRAELLWFYQEGASWIFPEIWDGYVAPIPPAERGDLIAAYYKRLSGDDETEKLRCAKAWATWEGSTLSLYPDPQRATAFGGDHFALAFARIECHYFINKGFFDRDDWILANIGHIRHVPGVIVHGRYDMCTPVKNAFDLKAAWPEAELNVVADAGHAVNEPGIVHELVRATERFRACS